MRSFARFCALAFTLPALAQPPDIDGYLVLADPSRDGEFLPAARAMADMHAGKVREIDFGEVAAGGKFLLDILRQERPRFVVFVVAPERIDAELCHRALEACAAVDADPFLDFEYGFITGRDGPAAAAFVQRIRAARDRQWGSRAVMLGLWEGAQRPAPEPQSAFKAMGMDAEAFMIGLDGPPGQSKAASRSALASMKGADLLMFFSHGYPEEMVGCFSGADLRQWNVDLSPAVLVSCACFNACIGPWHDPSSGAFLRKPAPTPDNSVALAIIDSGVTAFFGGADAWHGPLANQLVCALVDDGLRLGQAAKFMGDRLALDFMPGPIAFAPISQRGPPREGAENRRYNGAAMILFGDPALAPFAPRARRLIQASAELIEAGDAASARLRVTIRVKPLVEGKPAMIDFMLPQARLMDYYSVKTPDVVRELSMEVYRSVALPQGVTGVSALAVTRAVAGAAPLKTGDPVWAIEKTPDGRRLHVRVPMGRILGSQNLMTLARAGGELVLEGEAQTDERQDGGY